MVRFQYSDSDTTTFSKILFSKAKVMSHDNLLVVCCNLSCAIHLASGWSTHCEKNSTFCNSYDFFPLFWIECIRVKCTSIKDSSFVSKCIALFICYGYCSFDFHAIQGGKDSLANKRMLIAGDPFMLPLAPPKK